MKPIITPFDAWVALAQDGFYTGAMVTDFRLLQAAVATAADAAEAAARLEREAADAEMAQAGPNAGLGELATRPAGTAVAVYTARASRIRAERGGVAFGVGGVGSGYLTALGAGARPTVCGRFQRTTWPRVATEAWSRSWASRRSRSPSKAVTASPAGTRPSRPPPVRGCVRAVVYRVQPCVCSRPVVSR